MRAATKPLSQLEYICRDKHVFVTTSILSSRQKYVCRDKHTFVATKDVFCRDKHIFVATKMILAAAPAPANDTSQRAGSLIDQVGLAVSK